MQDAYLDRLCENLKKFHGQEKDSIGESMFKDTDEPHEAFVERMEKLGNEKEKLLTNLVQYSASLCALHDPDEVFKRVFDQVGPKVYDDELEVNQERAFPGAKQLPSREPWKREEMTPDFYATNDLYHAQEFGDFPDRMSFKVSYSEGALSVVLSDVPFPVVNKSADSYEVVLTPKATELQESVHAYLSRNYTEKITVKLDDEMVRHHIQLQESALSVVSARNDLQQALTGSDEIIEKRGAKELATKNFERESLDFINHHGEMAFYGVLRDCLGPKSTLADQTIRKLNLGQELSR